MEEITVDLVHFTFQSGSILIGAAAVTGAAGTVFTFQSGSILMGKYLC